jgi:Tfp pilus assembly protein FimT
VFVSKLKKASLHTGVTILELVVVISIITLVASVVFVSFSRFRNNTLLNVEIENITSLISQARGDTLSSKNDSQYGVHFESARAVLFKGATFSEPSADNIQITLDSTLSISSITLNGGGSNVLFTRLNGTTDQYGTIVVRSSDASVASTTITIYKTGVTDTRK